MSGDFIISLLPSSHWCVCNKPQPNSYGHFFSSLIKLPFADQPTNQPPNQPTNPNTPNPPLNSHLNPPPLEALRLQLPTHSFHPLAHLETDVYSSTAIRRRDLYDVQRHKQTRTEAHLTPFSDVSRFCEDVTSCFAWRENEINHSVFVSANCLGGSLPSIIQAIRQRLWFHLIYAVIFIFLFFFIPQAVCKLENSIPKRAPTARVITVIPQRRTQVFASAQNKQQKKDTHLHGASGINPSHYVQFLWRR